MTRPTVGDEPNHSGLEAKIAGMITAQLTHLGYDLVRVAVLGRERPTVQVMADRHGTVWDFAERPLMGYGPARAAA